MALAHLPPDARPREKLLARGPQALADAELLALLLRTGLPGRPVLQMAQSLLDDIGGWPGLMNADVAALGRVRGLGPAKRAEIAAVLEIARRTLGQQLRAAPVFNSPAAVRDYVSLHLSHHGHEVFAVLFLDSQMQLLRMEEMFRGSLSQAAVYPHEIVKRALELGAASVILAHNHPSGVAEPSRADALLTGRIRDALALIDVGVIDHLVTAQGQAASMAERGML